MKSVFYPPNIHLNICEDISELAELAAAKFIEQHNNSSNRFYVVPGGSTPKLFYSNLVQKVGNWLDTSILLSDERLVNEDSKFSNTRLLKKELLYKIKADNKPEIIPIFIEGATHKEMQIALSEMIDQKINSNKINVAILGIGADGHTASLFPGNPKIFIESNENNFIVKNKEEPFFRMSLSFKTLMSSKQIFFLLKGTNKANALKECLQGDYNPLTFPAQYILKKFSSHIEIFCDQEATSHLQ